MTVKLTERMKAWIKIGCHLNVATKTGIPLVTVSRNVKSVSDDEAVFALSQDEYSVIEAALAENPWVAFGVSRAGGIRACYQFKVEQEESVLVINSKVKDLLTKKEIFII